MKPGTGLEFARIPCHYFKPTLTLASHSPMRIAHLRQRLHDLGAKPCHEDRLLRGWSQVCSYDRKHSPAETFFPLALRNELPAIEAGLNGLARLHGEYPANGHGNHDRSPTPTLTRHPLPQSSEGTTGHSTRPSENNGQVAGHPASGESEARGAEPGEREVGQAGILSQDKNSQRASVSLAGEGQTSRYAHLPITKASHGCWWNCVTARWWRACCCRAAVCAYRRRLVVPWGVFSA